MIGCIEETALTNRWITLDQMVQNADEMKKTQYGQYLYGVAADLSEQDD